jgi:hypothetical protein
MKNKTLRKTSKKLNKRKKISGGESLKFEKKDLSIAIKNLLEGVAKIEKDTLIELLKMYTAHQGTIIELLTPKKKPDEIILVEKITNLFVAIQTFCHRHLDAGLNTFAIVVQDIILRFYYSNDDTDYLYSIANALEADYNTCTGGDKTCENTQGVLKILHGYVNILHITAEFQINDMLGFSTLDFRKMKKLDGDVPGSKSNIGAILCIINSLKKLGAPTSKQDNANTKAVNLILTVVKEYLKPTSFATTINMGFTTLKTAFNATVKSIIRDSIKCTLTSRQNEFTQLAEEEKEKIDNQKRHADIEISTDAEMQNHLESLLKKSKIEDSERKREKPGIFYTIKKAFGFGQSRRGGKTKKKRPTIST